MVILSTLGNSAFRTESIDHIGFRLKLNKNDNPIKNRKGIYQVDKTKIDILFKSGERLSCLCPNEIAGQELFDKMVEAMSYNR